MCEDVCVCVKMCVYVLDVFMCVFMCSNVCSRCCVDNYIPYDSCAKCHSTLFMCVCCAVMCVQSAV
mgnify:CR=1 FL=1